jgi:oligopeptide transport system substrate-binding protein
MRNRRLAALALAATMLLAACGGSDDDTPDEQGAETPANVLPGGSVVDYQAYAAGEPTHIDPALAGDVRESQIARLLFDGLTKSDKAGVVKNAVAATVNPSADAKTWTFGLREGIVWENGDPVLASDFKFAWERVLNPATKSRLASRFSMIQGAEAMADGQASSLSGVTADDTRRELVVNLTSTYRDFPSVVSTTPFSPVPQKLFKDDPTLSSKWEQGVMVGNGAFRMAGPWERDRSIKLLRNDKYYGGTAGRVAYLDSVEFRFSKDLDSAYNDFEADEHGVGRVPPGQYSEASVEYGATLLKSPLLSTEYWGFNLSDPSVGGAGNLQLRQAIALAIDKKDIVAKLYGNARRVAVGWAPPGTPGYQITIDSGNRNVEAAKDLLKAWGKTPPEIKISFNAGAGHEEKATIIQQNLADIGVKATLNPVAQADYGRSVSQGTLQFFRGGWNADYISYDNFIAPLFTSPPMGDSNTFDYKNSKVDSLVTQARGEADETKRNNLYVEAERTMLKDQPVVPISWSSAGIVAKETVSDLTTDPLGYVNYGEVWTHR